MSGIYNRERAKQLIVFDNLEYDTQNYRKGIQPTDIDGILDYHNKGFIFYECKYGEKDITTGQDILFARLANYITKPVVLILCKHFVHDAKKDVVLADCIVTKIKISNREWIEVEGYTVKQITDMCVEAFEKKDMTGLVKFFYNVPISA